MRLGPDDINACRALVQWIFRGVGTLAMAGGAFLCVSRLLWDLGTGEIFRNGLGWSALRHSHDLALLIVGAALASGAHRLSKWIVVVPSMGCPRCGHARAPGAQDTRCSECGLEWPRT